MNPKRLNDLLRAKALPAQDQSEWRMFREICELYLGKHNIENPVVVELGIGRNRQKKTWNLLLGAEHIGIDRSERRGNPDILGDTHDPKTMKKLKRKLKGKPINILFIDASHRYENIKKDYELYASLCNDIIAIHDIELGRHQDLITRGVWKFWDELKMRVYNGEEEYRNITILSIHHYKSDGDRSQRGIGVILKR